MTDNEILKGKIIRALSISAAAQVGCVLKADECQPLLDMLLLPMVNVPIGLLLSVMTDLIGCQDTYPMPVTMVQEIKQALYRTGSYVAIFKAGELAGLLDWKEKQNESDDDES